MNLKTIFTFSLGAAVGSVITWAFVKGKYERLANEEIESVKEVFSRKYTELEPSDINTEEADEDDEEDEEVVEYKTMVNDLEYSNEEEEEEEEEMDEYDAAPYVITPEEFGEYDDFEPVTLVYYADGVLVDEEGDPMDDDEINYYVGWANLRRIGEYEPDAVHVRNEITKGEYEILRDLRNYSDVCKDTTTEV